MDVIFGTEKISIAQDGQEFSYPRQALPAPFLEWQSVSRMEMYNTLRNEGYGKVRMQPAHLPVLATLGEGIFPINLATRGIGMLPKEPLLERFTALFEETGIESQQGPWEASLEQRIRATQEFYCDPDHFDPLLLGGLEIFEGQTQQNLQENPLCSLLYTGEAPRYPSYQFNAAAQDVGPENSYYRFLLAARQLFARDPFHLHQTRYPVGYLFYPLEIKNKTPYPRK